MIIKKYFDGKVILFQQNKFKDRRGFFSEIYNLKELKKIGIKELFLQDNFSYSNKKGVIRGLHFQCPPNQQSKLIRVLNGKILDVVVDIRKGSKTYGKHETFIISRQNWRQLFISSGFAHGFCTLEDKTDIEYKVSSYFSKKSERTIKWNDSLLGINWKINISNAILSSKDKQAIDFSKLNSPFKV